MLSHSPLWTYQLRPLGENYSLTLHVCGAKPDRQALLSWAAVRVAALPDLAPGHPYVLIRLPTRAR